MKKNGYGVVYDRSVGHHMLVHRLAWEMVNGPIPEGLEILHECDTKICVRISHLRLDTHKNNMQDAWDRNRIPIGEDSKSAKLKSSDVMLMRKLRAEGTKVCDLARQFGVGHPTVIKICNGERWKHLPIVGRS